MKNLYKIEDELYIVSDKEKSPYCIKECPMAGLNIDRCDCQIFTACSNKVGNIILTTNKLLIKDGVQAIDDEFLEWFCQNSSCEEVEVKKIYLSNDGQWKDVLLPSEWEVDTKVKYKIIIPSNELSKDEIDRFFVDMVCSSKEEPKQECCKDISGFYLGTTCPKCNKPFRSIIQEPKQETLEEAAEKYAELSYYGDEIDAFVRGAKWGAKWQSERMYSEEDMWEAYKASNTIFEDEVALEQEFKEWLEQFKKK